MASHHLLEARGAVIGLADRAGELVVDGEHAAQCFEGAKAEAMEFIVQNGSKIAGKPLHSIHFPSHSLIGMVVRDGAALIPDGNMILRAHDRAVIFTLPGKAKSISSLFQGQV